MLYNIFVIFTIIMLFLYYRSDYERDRCVNVIFGAMWVLFSIEYYTTMDYFVYADNFDRPGMHDLWEPLYQLLLRIFNPVGFTVFNSCMAAFELFTLCYIFNKAVPKNYLWVGLLILILDPQRLFLFMDIKRQFLAMMASLWILYFMIYSTSKLRIVYAIISFVCAINIHTSAYASLAYFIIPLFRFRLNKIMWCVIFVLFIGGLSFKLSEFSEILSAGLELIQNDNLDDRYSYYISEQEKFEEFGLGEGLLSMAYIVLYLTLLLVYNKKASKEQYPWFLMSIIGILLNNILFGSFYRLNCYFEISNIVTIPILINFLGENTDASATLPKRMLYATFLALSLLLPAKTYILTMTGIRVDYTMAKYRYFYTIFDEVPDRNVYEYDGFTPPN